MVFVRNDPCGHVCLAMTYGAVLYADYVVVNWIVLPTMAGTHWAFFHIFAFNLVVVLLFSSHARAVFTDPGIVRPPSNRTDSHAGRSIDPGPDSPPDDDDWTICTRCEMYRPPRAHHCRVCRRCVRRMDHHCPWINNCVGEWNQKYFLQFLFYVALLSGYSIALVAHSWYYTGPVATGPVAPARELVRIKQSRVLHSILLVFESILFGLFVSAIGCDQFDAIFNDETLVEKAKKAGPYRPKKSKMSLLADVFGHEHPIKWLMPCHAVRRGPGVQYVV